MKRKISICLASLFLCATAANAQTAAPMSTITPPTEPGPQMRGDGPPPTARPFSITRADPALDAIVAPDAKATELASGFGLNEGATWVNQGDGGYLLVSGLLDNVIYKVTLDGKVSVFLDHAGYTGEDPEHVGTQTRSGRSHVILIGPSCTSRDAQGRLIWCADNDRMIMRLEKDGTRTVMSAGYNGKRFSGPNDIAIKADGAIYVADNDFGLRDAGKSPDKQMPNGIFLIKDGKTQKVLSDEALGSIPNGIALSPDEKYLYLSSGFKKILKYAVKSDGTLGPGTVFTAGGVGIGDGMKFDRKGNLFSSGGAGPGEVRITSPQGKFLGSLNLPVYGGEPKKQICATNVAFGGPDGKTLFVTACDAVYAVPLKTPGIVPGPQ